MSANYTPALAECHQAGIWIRRAARALDLLPREGADLARGARPIQRVCGWKREQEARARRLHLLKSNNTYKNHINHIISD